MNTYERSRFNTFVTVNQFGIENAADFPSGSVGQTQFEEIALVIPLIQDFAADQTGGTREAGAGYLSRDTARENLRQAVGDVSRTSRSMEYAHPGISTIFRMPENRTDAGLIAAAKAFAAAFPPYEDAFIAYGLPAEFLADLTAVTTDFEQALSAPAAGMSEQVAATAELGAAIRRGMQALRVLEGVVRNKYRDNVGKLAAWETASHIERAPKPKTTPLKKTGKTTPDEK
jgi:hypothetical protein